MIIGTFAVYIKDTYMYTIVSLCIYRKECQRNG